MANMAVERGKRSAPYIWEGSFARLTQTKNYTFDEPIVPRTWADDPARFSSEEIPYREPMNLQLRENETMTHNSWELVPAESISNHENIVDLMQNLYVEEDQLTGQKERLTVLLNQLKVKVGEKVEERKERVERLTSEVLDLKERCEKLTGLINTESTQG